jgi:RasGEF domain
VILGPDGFMRRAKVAEHFISIALALRRLNNYFGAHALTNGIRGTLVDGDTLEMKVAETPDFKLFLSMEKLFSSRGSFSAYRLALRNSHGPVIPDLYVTLQFFLLSGASFLSSFCQVDPYPRYGTHKCHSEQEDWGP